MLIAVRGGSYGFWITALYTSAPRHITRKILNNNAPGHGSAPAPAQEREMLSRMRATEYGQRCRQHTMVDATRDRYGHAWTERAKTSEMPERFALETPRHNRKVVYRAYAKRGFLKGLSLEDYEKRAAPPINGAKQGGR